jgi:hypothetical protein
MLLLRQPFFPRAFSFVCLATTLQIFEDSLGFFVLFGGARTERQQKREIAWDFFFRINPSRRRARRNPTRAGEKKRYCRSGPGTSHSHSSNVNHSRSNRRRDPTCGTSGLQRIKRRRFLSPAAPGANHRLSVSIRVLPVISSEPTIQRPPPQPPKTTTTAWSSVRSLTSYASI